MPNRIPTVAIAESCTGGLVMAHIVATPGSGDWFKGGIVAYDKEVKFHLLGVERGPVVTSAAAAQMAQGIRDMIGSDLGIATTGEAGPYPEEDMPVGTLFVAVADDSSVQVHHSVLTGEPEEIRASAAETTLTHLRRQTGLNAP